MTSQESTFSTQTKLAIDQSLMYAIGTAIVLSEREAPTLPNLTTQVGYLADQVYNLDEMLYYLDTEDTDVTIEHIREGDSLSSVTSKRVTR